MQFRNNAQTGLWSEVTILGTESYARFSTGCDNCADDPRTLDDARRRPDIVDLYLYRILSV